MCVHAPVPVMYFCDADHSLPLPNDESTSRIMNDETPPMGTDCCYEESSSDGQQLLPRVERKPQV